MTSLADCTEVERQLQISKDLFLYREKALALALQNRPKNTNKQYLSKQREWWDFYKETSFKDGEMVTERKLVWFLEEKVLCRPLQGSVYKSKRARTDRDGNTVLQTVGKSTVKLYVAAVVDLYRFQKSRGINFSDHSHGQLISAVLCTHETKESVQKQAHHLCTGLNFLMNHNMLLQEETSRTAQLPDLFTLQLSNERPTPCWLMILITDNGKTNQLRQLEKVFQTFEDALSDMISTFSVNRIPSSLFCMILSFQWVNHMYAAAGLLSSKKTHLGQSQRFRYDELNGVSEGQIRRAGRWNNDALTNCYLTNIPRETLCFCRGSSLTTLYGQMLSSYERIIRSILFRLFRLLRQLWILRRFRFTTLLTSSRTGNGYSLSRTIQSVPDLWREWTTGLGGGPSVQSLEDQGGSWRKSSSKEQMMFCRRKIIINEIRFLLYSVFSHYSWLSYEDNRGWALSLLGLSGPQGPHRILFVADQQLSPFTHSPQSRAVLALPGQDVPFVRGSMTELQVRSHRPSYINAILIQSRGRTEPHACLACRSAHPGLRPFPQNAVACLATLVELVATANGVIMPFAAPYEMGKGWR
ncbi:predicted protein [Histoplasma mississippiense (nom. inval.)]|uniref:predicted protein n=1 Tax=Ajellomyces capsulatus (strain NAm1 / WU24) TaxID=2059318 RepID=UPI000157C6CB|nr:predicted protein [Histoplasma mississippiense (nom. inval.)]EDN08635.1 predicted protein [Histoplasma mississippiense (nom. inval.)]